MITPQLQIDVKSIDLEALLGEGDPLSSRDFHTKLLQQAAPAYYFPELVARGDSNWWHATYHTMLAPDIGYVLSVVTSSYGISSAFESRDILIFKENLTREHALKYAQTIKNVKLEGRLLLMNPNSDSEATRYQPPFSGIDLSKNKEHAVALIIESFLRGISIAEVGKLDDISRLGDRAFFFSINHYGGLTVAVNNPTSERVHAAANEFRQLGKYLSDHREALLPVIAALEPAYDFKYDKSRPDQRPEFYAAADKLLQGIERPKLDILKVPMG